MAKPLTAEQIAIVCAMRSKGAKLDVCARAVHRDRGPVRDALVAKGLDVSRKGGWAKDPGAKPRGSKPRTRWGAGVKCAIGAVMGGGRFPQPVGSYYCVGKCDWTNCQSVKPCEFLHGFSHRCLREDIPCDDRVNMCDAEVTDDNRLGFASFLAHRAEDARKIAGDRKYKSSYGSNAAEQAVLAREMRGERDE